MHSFCVSRFSFLLLLCRHAKAPLIATKEIFVYSGLIDLLEKEEPLIAAVMAHEISKSFS